MGQKGAKESEVEKHLTKCLESGAKESKLKELYNTMDTHKLGMLTQAQFSQFATAYVNMVQKKIAEKNLDQVELSFIEPKDLDEFVVKLFHSIDQDKNGNISFEEFVQFMRSDISQVVSNAKSQKIVRWMSVAIVGLPGSGKSSLLIRYCDNIEMKEEPTSRQSRRKFVETETKIAKLDIDDFLVNLRHVKKEEHELKQSSYRAANGFILCVDLSIPFEVDKIEKEYSDIKSIKNKDILSPEPFPIFLVGTKSDLQRSISKEEIERFANANGMKYFETSSKNNDNVEQLFTSLVQEILNTTTSTL